MSILQLENGPIQGLEAPSFNSGMASLLTTVAGMNHQLEEQRTRIKELENQISQLQRQRGLPDSNLFNDSFVKRAFTIFGHWLVAYLIIAIPLGFLIALGG